MKLGSINKKLFSSLVFLAVKGVGSLSESVIKKRKVMAKVFFLIMLSQVLKNWEKLYLLLLM